MSTDGSDGNVETPTDPIYKRLYSSVVPASAMATFQAQDRLNKLLVQTSTAPAIAALDKIQKQLAASAGVASTVERMQQQLATTSGVASLMEVVQKQLTASTGVFSVIEGIRAQQSSVSAAMAPFLAQQTALMTALSPMTEKIARLQTEIASSLNVAILSQTKWQADLASLAMGPQVGGALRQIAELASIKLAMPTADGVSRLAELIEAGEIDVQLVDEAEQSIAINTELSQAIDEAAGALAASRPFLSRERARQLVVVWVWLMYGAALWAVAIFGPPALVAVPAALGAPAAPEAARAVADMLLPRRDVEH